MNAPDPARAAALAPILALVRRSVRCRFALSAEDFAGIVVDRSGGQANALALDDLYLATACAQGDEQAWREFRDRYFGYMGDFARRFLPDAAALDVRDQIIADLWQRKRLGQYDGRSTLRTWLGAFVTHASINARRTVDRSTPIDDAAIETPRPTSATVSPEDRETHRGFAALVERAIANLDPESKLLLLLYYEQGLTLEEMSGVLNASKATLSRRLARTREALRSAIDAMATERADADAGITHHLDFTRLEWDLSGALGPVPLQKKRGGSV